MRLRFFDWVLGLPPAPLLCDLQCVTLSGIHDPQRGHHLRGLGAAGAGPGGPLLGHSTGQLPGPLPAE